MTVEPSGPSSVANLTKYILTAALNIDSAMTKGHELRCFAEWGDRPTCTQLNRAETALE